MGKNNKQQPLKQFQRFGIRKFNQGVASVMIASGMFFLAGGMVSANEAVLEDKPQTEEKVTTETNKAEAQPVETKVETPALDKTNQQAILLKSKQTFQAVNTIQKQKNLQQN